jgi:hypothetical protein
VLGRVVDSNAGAAVRAATVEFDTDVKKLIAMRRFVGWNPGPTSEKLGLAIFHKVFFRNTT